MGPLGPLTPPSIVCESLLHLPAGLPAMRSIRRAAHDESTSSNPDAMTGIIDALQVLVRCVETNEAAAAQVRGLLMRLLQRLPEPSLVPRTTNFRVARVVRYLEEHFADATISLASAARHVEVTPSHLDRLLKEHTGLPFLQHLRLIRVRHAETLLLTTTSSIKETAYACGYAGTCGFGRDFKRTHGCAARPWRAMRMLHEVAMN
jgi:AraC-like DNA-binding protein